MAFAGNCGFDVNLHNSNIFEELFAEEAGAVIEVCGKNIIEASRILKWYGILYSRIGITIREDIASVLVREN